MLLDHVFLEMDFEKHKKTLKVQKWTMKVNKWTLQNALGPSFFVNGLCKMLLDFARSEKNHVSRQMDNISLDLETESGGVFNKLCILALTQFF